VGSKHALSNGKETEEVTDLIAAFEVHNKCKIVLFSSLELHNGYLDMHWTAVAGEEKVTSLVPPSLGSLSVSLWGGDYKTLVGLLSRLLYALDFRLAESEFDKAIVK
jgi:hypothetical protein